MAAYAALVSLMNNLEQIQRHTRFPISPDQEQMESLHEKLSFLIDFLESCCNSRQEMKELESRIADAAYAAQDIIETHVVDRIIATSKGETEKTTPTLTCLLGIEKVVNDMDFIKEEVMKIKDKRGIDEDSQLKSPITAHSSSSIPVGKNTMVGFDDELNRITKRLIGRQRSRQIIPIVGMGGIGKTTLAKTAFEKPFIVKHFDFCAWVSISQEYNLKKILLGLLPEESNQKSENELKETLHKSLYGRRYLVVLDDMWSVEAWEMVKLFLPDNNNGSRIIATTRVSSVATHLDSCSLEMNFLDEDKSWNLLCEKVFAREGCPLELEEVGRKIVKNCKGLPLSIVVIGGLLAKSKRSKEYWEYVARDTKEIISSEGDEQCMKILSLSYHNLPIHLKPCFLYMGVFREDLNIPVYMLINLWVAEGFLKPNRSKELELVGEECLNDLISRNLIFVDKCGSDGKIKLCMIHDLVRDLCLKEAHEEKFLHVPKMHSHDEVQCISSQRRISFHQSSSNKEYIPQVLNKLKSGSMGRSLICDIYQVLPLQNFRLLRVLKALHDDYYGDDDERHKVRYLLDDIFKLVNSRFIAITTEKLFPTFPSSVCLLWNLQILVVRGNEEEPIAPLEIWEMTELRHLQFEDGLYLPDPPPSQQRNRQEDDSIMKNLHTLMRIKDFSCTDEVVKRIPNIKKLKICYGRDYTGKEFKEFRLKNLGLLKKLESLTCDFMGMRRCNLLPNLAFPCSLKKLSLEDCGLNWEDMTMIGSLPHLEVLILKEDSFKGAEWVTVEGGFCCLKYLEIESLRDLVHWESDSAHFPCLEHLVLWWLPKLVEIPSGIGEIPTLQWIKVYCCSNSVVISAKKILEEQEELGNVGIQVYVQEE